MFSSVAKDLLRKNPKLNEKLIIQTPAVMSFTLFPYLNKKHAKLLPKLESSLHKLKVNGFIEKVTKKYQVTPEKVTP